MMLCFTRVNETEATVSNVPGAIYIFVLIGLEYFGIPKILLA